MSAMLNRLPSFHVNHALGGAAVLFAAIAVWPWLVPPAPTARTLPPPQRGAEPPALTALPPIASFSAIVERPLFAPSRRPPPGAASALGPSLESRYRLIGIVATGPRRKAFIADGARRSEIVEGDTLDGWTVKQIEQDRIVLSSPQGEAALKLKPAAGAEATKPQ